jgi:pentachlorophenol monooxygenase
VNFSLRLFELLADPQHALLLYADETGPTPDLAEVVDVLATMTGGRARTYLITPDPGLIVAGPPVIVDAAGEFRDTYGAVGGSGYLVRPDGYLGFRAAPLMATALRRHLERMFAPAPVPAQYDIRPGGDGGVPPVRALPRSSPP